ncbi:uncharacterized protein [Coffea arabica]|uniref:Uncharacterized protein isoform X2 n=1 Tax=Coffea arabica TaxID=13443 RepID=A0A6P6SKB3_COFAR|nr:uncharacterized protein LOC113692377 isoform X2 [Coffea arabica]
MASLLNPPLTLPQKKVNCGIGAAAATVTLPNRNFLPTVRTAGNHRPHLVVNAKSSTQADMLEKDSVSVEGVDDKSDFGVVSMHHVGILCENLERSLDFYQNILGRPEHGGRDRHTCIAIRDVPKLKAILDKAGIAYTLSRSGRPAIFTRDPDANALEFTQVEA